MIESRRRFLKKAGLTTVAASLGFGIPFLRSIASAREVQHSTGETLEAGQLAMVIDVAKCRNPDLIRACTEVCRIEHNLPGNESDPERLIRWLWTQKFEHTFPDQAHDFISPGLMDSDVPVLCNHCTKPACVKVCPTKATWKRESDGIVMMDMHRCIGCRYCVVGCPYGSRCFNWRDPRPHIENILPEYPTRMRGVVEKCTFCADRLREGLEPLCVEAARKVPGGEGALTFGKLTDPHVAKLLHEKRTISRQNALGTGPNVYYIV